MELRKLSRNFLLVFVILYLISLNYFYYFGGYNYAGGTIEASVHALIFSIILGLLFGYVRYATDKCLEQNNYTKIKFFFIGLFGSVIISFITFILFYLTEVRGAYAGEAGLGIIIIAFYLVIFIIVTSILCTLYSYSLFKLKEKYKFRKFIYYGIIIVLVILITSFFILNAAYARGKSYSNCLFRDKYAASQCVAEFSLAQKNPEPCSTAFDEAWPVYECYRAFLEKGMVQYFDDILCENLNSKKDPQGLYSSHYIKNIIDSCHKKYSEVVTGGMTYPNK